MDGAERLNRGLVALASFSSRHARAVLAVATLGTLAALYYTATRIRFNTDRNSLVAEDLPFKRAFERYEDEFPTLVDNLVLVVDAETPEDARAAALELARRIAADEQLFAGASVPRARPFLERHALLYLAVDELERLAERLARVQPFLGRLAADTSLRGLCGLLEQALERGGDAELELDPVLERVSRALEAARAGTRYRVSWRELMQAGGPDVEARRQFVMARPRLDYAKLFPARAPVERIRELAAELGSGASVRITGALALSHEELVSVLSSAELIAGLVFAAVGTVLMAALRSVSMVLATLFTLVVGLALTAAFATFAVGHLNMISVAFGILYLGLGVNYAIHLCLRYRELREDGASHEEGLAGAVADIGGSLLVCALTTAVGFYAFIPTDFQGVSELGLISGTGMFFSLFVTLSVLSALLRFTPAPVRAPGSFADARALAALGRSTAARARTVLAATAALALASLALLPRLGFDANPLGLRDPRSESVRTFEELLASRASPPWSLTVLADAAAAADRVASDLRSLASVERAVSLSSFVPRDQETKLEIVEELALLLGYDLGGAPGAPPTADVELGALAGLASALGRLGPERASESAGRAARELAAFQAWLAERPERSVAAVAGLRSSLLGTFPASMELLSATLDARPVTLADLPQDLVREWSAADGVRRVEAFPREDLGDLDAMRRFVADVRAVAPGVTGSPVMILETGDAVVRAFQTALAIALVATALMVLALFRRLTDSLLVMLPLLLASLSTTAAMVLSGIEFNFANVIGLPLLLGMGIDSSIHVVHRWRSGMATSVLESSTARGVVYSAVVNFCSFANLAISPHRGLASMGVILTIGIVSSLLYTLVALPALLALRSRR